MFVLQEFSINHCYTRHVARRDGSGNKAANTRVCEQKLRTLRSKRPSSKQYPLPRSGTVSILIIATRHCAYSRICVTRTSQKAARIFPLSTRRFRIASLQVRPSYTTAELRIMSSNDLSKIEDDHRRRLA